MQKLVTEITSQKIDFAQWYSDICLKAKLMEYTSSKGFIIYLPYGFRIWELIQSYLNKEFQKGGRQNVYFPLVIPESLFNKEKDHVEGFAPEVALISKAGGDDLSDRLVVRPTSEVLFCEYYKNRIQSYRDLPLKFNQWCSVVRWEKTTRPFLRGKEFLWQEGHTIHETASEAKKETLDVLKIYKKLGSDFLAIPFTTGKKTDREKFAGAKETYAIEALMPDGKALQSGTTHFFGTNFSEAFDIKFSDKEGNLKYANQSSWGVSTRLIGAIIMVHGDDNGLVLPPYVAPIQVRIIPIGKEEIVAKTTRQIYNSLKSKFRIDVDDSAKTPGFRFSECEMLGIPIRIEFGLRDIEKNQVTIVTRHDHHKEIILIKDLKTKLVQLLPNIHSEMYNKACDYLARNTYTANSIQEFETFINKGGYVKAYISNEDAEVFLKNKFAATARVILDEKVIRQKCIVSNSDAKYCILFARAY